MHKSDFVHLHVHSHYSLLDGACRLDDLIEQARKLGMPALALTDHGNLFGAVEFYQKALKAGIKPIVGIEAYVAPRHRTDRKETKGIREASYHLTLLVRNEKGYRNLLKLSSLAYREGFYYKPRMDKELLSQYSEGLIALSGCPNSEFSHGCRSGQMERAFQAADDLRTILGKENLYLEIQNHGMEDEKKIVEGAMKVSRDLGAKIVATNDIHYIYKDDARAHDALLSINTGKLVRDENRLRYPAPEFYLKSAEEMVQAFPDHPDALRTTMEIAGRCNLELSFTDLHLPHFEPPPGKDQKQMLRELCDQGLHRRYPEITPAARQRLEYELSVIEKMGFVSYFLIVWDFIRFAREHRIPVGPGRGSAAGSLVAYTLGITDVDPLKYGLIFERFLNPSRKELPDIDIDFCQEGRQQVIDYVRQKYGKDNVSQIITFGTMKAKQVIRDVGRVMDVDLATVDRVAKKVPNVLGITLHDALKDKEFSEEIRKNEGLEDLIQVAQKLEGLYRHASKHAAGVVISDRPLVEYVPLYVSGDDETTQFPMESLQKIGLLKMDFLGLETLTVLDKTLRLVHETAGVRVDLHKIPLDDAETFRALSEGNVKGVFQLETSRGMRDLIQKMRPDRFEDIIATVALFRPGPLQSGMVETYIRCKHGLEKPQYLHPLLEPILKETNGVILYQEQVMMIANRMAGFSLTDADILRKAMGKKQKALMDRFHEQFVQGAVKNGVDGQTAERVFELMLYFGGYGFNKSHSAAYALIAYQTAYLKTKYPVPFMAALMTCSRGNMDKVAGYIEECRRMKIEVLRPDLNESGLDFTVAASAASEKKDDGSIGRIRFGLGAIKNVGDKAIEIVLAEREKSGPFTGFFNFCERADLRAVDKKVMESLIKAGALDGLGLRRSQLFELKEKALMHGSSRQQDRRAGQLSFFDQAGSSHAGTMPDVPDIPEWSEEALLAFEKESIGVYVTSNPLLRYEHLLRDFASVPLEELDGMKDGAEVAVGGTISDLRYLVIKQGKNKGNRYAVFRIHDLSGTCEAVLFTSDLEKNRDYLKADAVCFLVGRVDFRREDPNLRVNQIIPADRVREVLTASIKIEVAAQGLEEDQLKALQEVMGLHPGSCPVFIEVQTPGGRRITVRSGSRFSITPSDKFFSDVEQVLGAGHARCVSRFRYAGKNPPRNGVS